MKIPEEQLWLQGNVERAQSSELVAGTSIRKTSRVMDGASEQKGRSLVKGALGVMG